MLCYPYRGRSQGEGRWLDRVLSLFSTLIKFCANLTLLRKLFFNCHAWYTTLWRINPLYLMKQQEKWPSLASTFTAKLFKCIIKWVVIGGDFPYFSEAYLRGGGRARGAVAPGRRIQGAAKKMFWKKNNFLHLKNFKLSTQFRKWLWFCTVCNLFWGFHFNYSPWAPKSLAMPLHICCVTEPVSYSELSESSQHFQQVAHVVKFSEY